MNFDDLARLSFEEFDAVMRSSVTVDYDPQGDVLYVRRNNARTKYSAEAPNDGYVILTSDASDTVVAVNLMAASEMPIAFWPTHPDREMIPLDLRAEMDAWIRKNGKAGK